MTFNCPSRNLEYPKLFDNVFSKSALSTLDLHGETFLRFVEGSVTKTVVAVEVDDIGVLETPLSRMQGGTFLRLVEGSVSLTGIPVAVVDVTEVQTAPLSMASKSTSIKNEASPNSSSSSFMLLLITAEHQVSHEALRIKVCNKCSDIAVWDRYQAMFELARKDRNSSSSCRKSNVVMLTILNKSSKRKVQ